MVYGIDCDNRGLSESTSSSWNELFNQTTVCSPQPRPPRCCTNSMINDHTYCLLKRICHKFIKDYSRKQCREKYTIFDGGNSVNVRIHRSSCAGLNKSQGENIGPCNSFSKQRKCDEPVPPRCANVSDFNLKSQTSMRKKPENMSKAERIEYEKSLKGKKGGDSSGDLASDARKKSIRDLEAKAKLEKKKGQDKSSKKLEGSESEDKLNKRGSRSKGRKSKHDLDEDKENNEKKSKHAKGKGGKQKDENDDDDEGDGSLKKRKSKTKGKKNEDGEVPVISNLRDKVRKGEEVSPENKMLANARSVLAEKVDQENKRKSLKDAAKAKDGKGKTTDEDETQKGKDAEEKQKGKRKSKHDEDINADKKGKHKGKSGDEGDDSDKKGKRKSNGEGGDGGDTDKKGKRKGKGKGDEESSDVDKKSKRKRKADEDDETDKKMRSKFDEQSKKGKKGKGGEQSSLSTLSKSFKVRPALERRQLSKKFNKNRISGLEKSYFSRLDQVRPCDILRVNMEQRYPMICRQPCNWRCCDANICRPCCNPCDRTNQIC